MALATPGAHLVPSSSESGAQAAPSDRVRQQCRRWAAELKPAESGAAPGAPSLLRGTRATQCGTLACGWVPGHLGGKGQQGARQKGHEFLIRGC